MSEVPNKSSNVGVAPSLHTSPYKRRKIMKEKLKQYYTFMNKKKKKKKMTVKDILIKRKELEK